MREIKFRAWDNQGKHWYPAETMKDFFNYLSEKFAIIADWFNKDEISLEQYTGLKDKNGKEIYEGDIVFFFTEHFDKATGGFDGEDEHNATVEWFDNGIAFMDKIPYDPNIECEVIGNIHENPELLEEEE